jgi:hypothetical protein
MENSGVRALRYMSSIVVCTVGACIGFHGEQWWMWVLASVCVLGIAAAIIQTVALFFE